MTALTPLTRRVQKATMTIDNASITVPPGITPGRYVEAHAGARNVSWEWLSYPKTKNYTNAFIVQDGKVSDAFSVYYMAYSDSGG